MVIQIGRLEDPVSFPKDKSEWHHFLEGRVDDAVRLRDYVDNLPETSATFRINNIDGFDPQGMHRGLVKLTGAWKAPTTITNNRDRHWTNPNYKYAHHYSDAAVECECGIPVLRQQFSENEKQPAHHQDHKDGCTKIDRLENQVEIAKNRKQIVKEAYQYGHSAASQIQRLGYSDRRKVGAGDVEGLGLDLAELAREGRKKVARTAMVLCREHSPVKVAKIYGMSRKSLSQIVTKETKSDASALYSVRRAV